MKGSVFIAVQSSFIGLVAAFVAGSVLGIAVRVIAPGSMDDEHRLRTAVGVYVSSSAIGVLVGLRAWRKRRCILRLYHGLCVACGYDLRESRERCPECGTPIPLVPIFWYEDKP